MGNQPTVLISCHVDKDFGHGGETLTGTVHVQVKSSKPLEYFQGVTVTLAWMEYELRLLPDGRRLTRTNGTKLKYSKTICKFERGLLPAGTYEFPFALELPNQDSSAHRGSSTASSSGSQDGDEHGSSFTKPSLMAMDRSDNSSSSTTVTSMSEEDDGSTVLLDMSNVEPFREVAYKLRASLKRKKGVPVTSDTDIWCQAVCRPLLLEPRPAAHQSATRQDT